MKLKIATVLSTIILAVWCFVDITPAYTHITQPPAGNDGNPTSIPPGQTCAQCHAGGGLLPALGLVDIKIGQGSADTLLDSNFKYRPNTTYSMSFVPRSMARRHGFQISALDGADNNAGSFAITDAAHTDLVSVPINYLSHKNASGFKDWSFNWTSPDTGTVTFYYTFVSADSNGQNTNDTVYQGATVIRQMATGINALQTLSGLRIYPQPANDAVFIGFENHAISVNEAAIYSMDGKLMEQVVLHGNEPLSLMGIAPGIYLLKITAEGKVGVKKLVVQ